MQMRRGLGLRAEGRARTVAEAPNTLRMLLPVRWKPRSRLSNRQIGQVKNRRPRCGENTTAVPKIITLPKSTWPQSHSRTSVRERLNNANPRVHRDLGAEPGTGNGAIRRRWPNVCIQPLRSTQYSVLSPPLLLFSAQRVLRDSRNSSFHCLSGLLLGIRPRPPRGDCASGLRPLHNPFGNQSLESLRRSGSRARPVVAADERSGRYCPARLAEGGSSLATNRRHSAARFRPGKNAQRFDSSPTEPGNRRWTDAVCGDADDVPPGARPDHFGVRSDLRLLFARLPRIAAGLIPFFCTESEAARH